MATILNHYNLTMLAIIVISYLLGSFPTAYLAASYKKLNIFDVGSGNMGATNVLRSLGWQWGLVVFICDVSKGIIAILIARQMAPATTAGAMSVAATVVIIGHNWSFFAALLTGTLRGGKGAATTFGTILVIAPFELVLVMIVVAAVVLVATRYVSLAVLVSFSLATLLMTWLILQKQLAPDMMFYAWMLILMLVVRHRENIQRLIAGTERRIGERI